MRTIRDRWGAEAILPFCYGGSNGLLTQDTTDAALFRGFKTSRLARTVCAAPTGAANQALYGKMPGVTYVGLSPRSAHRALGRESLGLGNSSRPLRPRSAACRREAGRRRSADDDARPACRHSPRAASRNRRAAGARASTTSSSRHGAADERFLAEFTTGADRLRARAAEWSIERAAETAGVDARQLRQFAEFYASTSPAAGALRLGPRA